MGSDKRVVPLEDGKCRRRRRRGAAVIYGIIGLVVGLALCLLAVDYGRAQVVKTELQSIADATARAAATGLATSVDEAKSRARALGRLSKADGQEITFANGDFRFGQWNSSTNTIDPASGSAIDAVEVTARRTVTLTFGGIVGASSTDIAARATARVRRGSISGFIGLNGIDAKNNIFMAGYTAAPNVTPTEGTANGKGAFGTNGSLDVNNNAIVKGEVVLGPSGVFTLGTPTPIRLSSNIASPTIPTMPTGNNPNGVPHSLTVNGTTTLPGGTYWFTSLTVGGELSFSGPATVFVNGDVELSGTLMAYQNVPANLTVYVVGSNRSFGVDGSNHTKLAAVVVAPTADFAVKNNLEYYGSGIFNTIWVKNNASLFYDVGLGDPTGKPGVTTVR